MRAFPHPLHGATHRQPTNKLKIAVAGAGYWAPNLARNLQALEAVTRSLSADGKVSPVDGDGLMGAEISRPGVLLERAR